MRQGVRFELIMIMMMMMMMMIMIMVTIMKVLGYLVLQILIVRSLKVRIVTELTKAPNFAQR